MRRLRLKQQQQSLSLGIKLGVGLLLFIVTSYVVHRNRFLNHHPHIGSIAATTTTTAHDDDKTDDDTTNENPHIILVFGHHHSMTSPLTKSLIDMGLAYGGERDELLLREDNDMKYYELAAAVRLNQALFDRVVRYPPSRPEGDMGTGGGGGGGAKLPFSQRRFKRGPEWLGFNFPRTSSVVSPDFKRDVRSVVENLVKRAKERGKVGRGGLSFSGSLGEKPRAVVIKDPRMCLTADDWVEAARDVTKRKPICLVVVREPIESSFRLAFNYNENVPGGESSSASRGAMNMKGADALPTACSLSPFI